MNNINTEYFKFNYQIKYSNKSKSNFLIRFFDKIIPLGNPKFEKVFENVKIWMIEYDLKNDYITKEIGLDGNFNVLTCSPYEKDQGFWIDTDLNLKYLKTHFVLKEIDKDFFYNKWKECENF